MTSHTTSRRRLPLMFCVLFLGPGLAVAATAQPALDLAAMQQQLLSDPQTMAAITSLQSDPEIQAALADPEFTALIMSGNIEALRADPRAQRLMANPALQAIVGQVLVP